MATGMDYGELERSWHRVRLELQATQAERDAARADVGRLRGCLRMQTDLLDDARDRVVDLEGELAEWADVTKAARAEADRMRALVSRPGWWTRKWHRLLCAFGCHRPRTVANIAAEYTCESCGYHMDAVVWPNTPPLPERRMHG